MCLLLDLTTTVRLCNVISIEMRPAAGLAVPCHGQQMFGLSHAFHDDKCYAYNFGLGEVSGLGNYR